MAGINYIYQFGSGAAAPFIQTDAQYDADAMRTAGWQPGIVRQAFLNKVDRQGNSIAAGVGQFIADKQFAATDVTDDLSPSALSGMISDAVGKGNLATSFQYGSNTTLTIANIGSIVQPTTVSLAFELPLAVAVPNGARIEFDGNTHGCVIAGQGGDTIYAGTSGAIAAVSLKENDSAIFTMINGQWTLTGGEAHQAVSSGFQSSLTSNGWAILPDGRIEQWGLASIASNSSPTGNTNVIAMPISWPNGFLNGYAIFAQSAPGSGGSHPQLGIGPGTSVSNIRVYLYAAISLPSELVYWRAIGH